LTVLLSENPHAAQGVRHWGDSLAEAKRVALMVHGRDQDPEWMREHLVTALHVPGTAYVAPAAADGTWYPGSFMDPLEVNEPRLTWALDRIHGLVGDLVAGGREHGEIFLIGFSQGACVVLEYFSRHPAPFGGVVALTGGLFGPPGTTWDGPFLSGVPVRLATSDGDELVPLERVEATRRALAGRGADVTLQVYVGMGHEIIDDEVSIIENLLAGVATC
jgi:phospholipase/carboxylesterase